MSAPRFHVSPLSNDFVRLIDVVFGLTITQGFLIYKESIIYPNLTLQNFLILVAFSTIILSWVGYHKSISLYPYNKSNWSWLRLLFDILILVLYARIVFVAKQTSEVLFSLMIIFFLLCSRWYF